MKGYTQREIAAARRVGTILLPSPPCVPEPPARPFLDPIEEARMRTCVTCKWPPLWLETYHPIGLPHGGDWRCNCPAAVTAPLVQDPVTGTFSDNRPRCIDVNPTGECPWWELPEGAHLTEAGRLVLPAPPHLTWLQRLLGIK